MCTVVCSSPNNLPTATSADGERVVYSVKVVRRSVGVSVETVTMTKKFESVAEMKNRLQSDFFHGEDFTFGYVKRGHGMNGRQIQIVSDEDVPAMYEDYRSSRKREFVGKIETQRSVTINYS